MKELLIERLYDFWSKTDDDKETLLKEIYNKFFSNESFSISISIFQNIETLCKNFYGNAFCLYCSPPPLVLIA